MAGVLLDTHALYWLVSGATALADDALAAIGENQFAGTLFVSPITAWELSLAAQKPPHRDPPRLDSTISTWFRDALRATSAKIVPIGQRIAIEAAKVPIVTGHRDPGDYYIIATARVRNIAVITRDAIIRKLAESAYYDVITC